MQATPAATRCRPAGFTRSWLGSLAALALILGSAHGQTLEWRSDYNAARREAHEKNRPLFLDFTTDGCYWCKQLEATTFRDPTVAAVLRDRFVCLRVEAPKNERLVEALHIQGFPTLVLAGPDGKILGTLEGYLDAAKLHGHLQLALNAVSNREWMARDYDEAAKAVAASEYARAVALLKSILADGQERPVQAKARHLLGELEQQAAGRLAHARQLQDHGQATEALEALADLLKAYAGTQAAAEGGRLLTSLAQTQEVRTQERTRRARELLAQAREDYRTRQYLCCMDRCENLASSFGDLPEGAEAVQLASEIKSNPDWMQQACQSLSERLGLLYLCLAETWIKKGQPQEAAVCLERVVQAFPGSHQAEVAQERLAQLRGQPTRQADFTRPADPERRGK